MYLPLETDGKIWVITKAGDDALHGASDFFRAANGPDFEGVVSRLSVPSVAYAQYIVAAHNGVLDGIVKRGCGVGAGTRQRFGRGEDLADAPTSWQLGCGSKKVGRVGYGVETSDDFHQVELR